MEIDIKNEAVIYFMAFFYAFIFVTLPSKVVVRHMSTFRTSV
jgi:hypothetical protein